MKTVVSPKVSIIIPVYNPGKYFENCILSLINQTLKDIEIIFVIDCPTDGSEKVAEKYKRNDKRIKIIYNEENIHAGFSRNKGLEIASGEYIGFHDADDYSDFTMYEKLYDEANNNNIDAVRCNFHCIYPPNAKEKNEFYIYPQVTEDVSAKKNIYEKICNNTMSCVVWSHIFRTDFLRRNNLQFVDSSIVTSEDSVFMIEAYHHLDKLGTVAQGLYYHIFHETNTGKSYGHRSISNRIHFFEFLNDFLDQQNIGEKGRLSFLSENIVKSLYSASRQAIIILPLRQAIREIKGIRKNKLIMSSLEYLSKAENKEILSKQKTTVKLFVKMMIISKLTK